MTVQQIKDRFTPGLKIKLINMAGESQMMPGITGTVDFVDDIGQIHMKWETGSGLPLNIEVDKFEVM